MQGSNGYLRECHGGKWFWRDKDSRGDYLKEDTGYPVEQRQGIHAGIHGS